MKKLILSLVVLAVSVISFGQKRITQIKTVEEKLNEQYCTGLFKTTHGTYFDMLDASNANSASGYVNILDWLNGRVAGLNVYRTRYNVLLPYIRNSRAGIYVDELYRDADFLGLLSPADIAMIKVIKGPFTGGFNSPGGVIAIYTVGTDDEEEE